MVSECLCVNKAIFSASKLPLQSTFGTHLDSRKLIKIFVRVCFFCTFQTRLWIAMQLIVVGVGMRKKSFCFLNQCAA